MWKSVAFFSIFLNLSLAFELTIVHNNDFHAHYDAMNVRSNECNQKLEKEGKCYGGVARMAAKIKEFRSKKNVLVLNAGDNAVGTVYYTLFNWSITAEFMNYIGYDAMALGNHEFDKGWGSLKTFLNNVSKVPVVCCNIEILEDNVPKNLMKSTTVIVDGRKVGIIGYLTTTTSFISTPGDLVEFRDEIECIKEEVQKMKEQKVDIIIALGHSGFEKDKEIAQSIPEIDVVVGGHSNTFLYTGKNPSIEKIEDTYPVVVDHDDGRRTLVVSAYAYGKYLGVLEMNFDDNGLITNYNGNALLMDYRVKEDEEARELLSKYKKAVQSYLRTTVGSTAVLLDGHSDQCRRQECNMGNFITDATVFGHVPNASVKAYRGTTGWTNYPISILTGGGIRSSIDESDTGGEISLAALLTVMPFANTIDAIIIPGKRLKEAFEHSVANLSEDTIAPAGEFLQVSGIKVVYDLQRPKGNRVVRLQARCGADCRIPAYNDVQDDQHYGVLLINYMAKGGNGYTVFQQPDVQHINIGSVDYEVVKDYLEKHHLVVVGLEERSVFVRKEHTPSGSMRSKLSLFLLSVQIAVLKVFL